MIALECRPDAVYRTAGGLAAIRLSPDADGMRGVSYWHVFDPTGAAFSDESYWGYYRDDAFTLAPDLHMWSGRENGRAVAYAMPATSGGDVISYLATRTKEEAKA